MAELDIVSLYKQDLEKLYKQYRKLYGICAFSIVLNIVFATVYMIVAAGKMP